MSSLLSVRLDSLYEQLVKDQQVFGISIVAITPSTVSLCNTRNIRAR